MMDKMVVRLDKVKAVRAGHIYSVIDEANELQNGMVAKLDGLVEGERELQNIANPGTDSSLVLIANPEVNYEECRTAEKALGNYSIPAGTPARAYELGKTDIISISANGIDGTPVVGEFVIGQAGSKKLAAAEDVTNETFVVKVIDKESIGTTTAVGMPGVTGGETEFIVIEVVSN